jgi:hypothetical protein
MVARRKTDDEPPRSPRPPATTPQARENQMVSLAYDLAEKRMEAGTASAQEVTHFLKLGSSREYLEQERLRNENLLTQAKIELMASQQRQEELIADALNAMRGYQGISAPEDYDDYEG